MKKPRRWRARAKKNSLTPIMDLLATQPHIHRSDPLVDPAVVMAYCDALGKDVCASMLRAIHKDTKQSNCFAFDLERAEEFVRQGRDVFMVVGNGGHCDQDIHSCPALFFEHDDRPKEWQVGAWHELGLPEPSLQVDTQGKSIHSYFVLSEPVRPDRWRDLQRRLLDFADADRSLKNPSRIMRLPGCLRRQPRGKARRVEIINNTGLRYSAEQLDELLPELPPEPPRSQRRSGGTGRRLDPCPICRRRSGGESHLWCEEKGEVIWCMPGTSYSAEKAHPGLKVGDVIDGWACVARNRDGGWTFRRHRPNSIQGLRKRLVEETASWAV